MSENENFFHISEVYNRNSILENGLIPTFVGNRSHLERFRYDRLLKKNEDKIIYMWPDSSRNMKFVKDTIIAKVFLHLRNDIFWKFNDKTGEYFDFSTIRDLNLYKFNHMTFDIYTVQSNTHVKNYRPLHYQESHDDKTCTAYMMPEEFTHDDKQLVFAKKPQKKLKLVGQASFNFTKQKKYEIKILTKNSAHLI